MRALSRAGGKDCLVYRTTEKKTTKRNESKTKTFGHVESGLHAVWVRAGSPVGANSKAASENSGGDTAKLL